VFQRTRSVRCAGNADFKGDFMINQTAKSRAEATFKVRLQQKAEAPRALAEYDAARVALLQNTVRLRNLRLARDASLAVQKNDVKPRRTRNIRRTP